VNFSNVEGFGLGNDEVMNVSVDSLERLLTFVSGPDD